MTQRPFCGQFSSKVQPFLCWSSPSFYHSDYVEPNLLINSFAALSGFSYIYLQVRKAESFYTYSVQYCSHYIPITWTLEMWVVQIKVCYRFEDLVQRLYQPWKCKFKLCQIWNLVPRKEGKISYSYYSSAITWNHTTLVLLG